MEPSVVLGKWIRMFEGHIGVDLIDTNSARGVGRAWGEWMWR
jgi:hypothetical protein